VLLPGDPGRALMLAQTLLEEPRMFNHNRGLWGYTGTAPDGGTVTIQATGMGGPSAAIVLQELISLGARRAIRVGTCGALGPGLELGSLVIAAEAIAADGTSRALGAGERVPADGPITTALQDAAPRAAVGSVISVDLFYDADLQAAGDALAVEMEAAALFALGSRAGIAVGCVLTVSDTFDGAGARERIDDDLLQESAEAMGHVAVRALAAAP
jgi:DeoD family purine-nucleoside phosphorylase